MVAPNFPVFLQMRLVAPCWALRSPPQQTVVLMPKVVLARLRPSRGWGRILRVLESFGPRKNGMEPPVVVTFARRGAVRDRFCTAPADERISVIFGKQRPQWDSLVCYGPPIRGGEHSCFGYAQGNLGLGRVLLLSFPLCLSLQIRGDHPSLRFFLASGSAWLISGP